MTGEFILVFVTGLAGSLHCLGMCGPLVVAYSLGLRQKSGTPSPTSAIPWSAGFTHHLLFHLGRITTYGLLGSFGAWLVQTGGLWESILSVRTFATLAGGLVMIFLGLHLLKAVPIPFAVSAASHPNRSLVSRLIRLSATSQSLGSKAILGFAVGFLPCMLSWAMIVKAATTGNAVTGFLFMVIFGLGTLPVLFFTGFSASSLSFRLRLAGERVAASSVLVMGILLLVKGVTHLA